VLPLPFELACLPYALLRFFRLPVVSYAVPALVAVGQARYFHRRPRNPVAWLIRRLSVRRSLKVLERMQPASGGFLEAVPLTSFVVMSLAGSGRCDHPVVRLGVRFLLSSIRDDGSWPIDTNLATWNTSLAISALAAATGNVGALGCLDWLLSCQHQQPHPLTDAAPGGWGWSDLSGAVPDVDDTSAALLALVALRDSGPEGNRRRIESAAAAGVDWLLKMQNADGGWPTFCRGWGALPFDRSGADLTAHAIRALRAWRSLTGGGRVDAAIQRGLDYLAGQQRPDGSWAPLWFGNQHDPHEENPVYGTARVLLAYRDLYQLDSSPARRGLAWLAASRGHDGSWGRGGGVDSDSSAGGRSSVEETAVAVQALLSGHDDPLLRPAIEGGLGWLTAAVGQKRHRQPTPIGFYFAKLWYHERLYPLTFTVAALGQAIRQLAPGSKPAPASPPPGNTETAG
jgi:squalene-hopene/tetraprenyl-beta-curcumene cyclase